MLQKYNILLLHRLGNPKKWRKSVEDIELSLCRFHEKYNYIVHDASCKIPEYIKKIQFHSIILGSTFLCARYHDRLFNSVLNDYSFIRDSRAVKLAFPQDDYDCSAILDEWMVSWGVDKVYSVCPQHWDILYPNFIKSGGELELAYTGYITDEMIEYSRNIPPISERPFDIVYRANRLPPNFGRVGFLKGEIVELFNASCDNSLKVDIGNSSKKVIYGTQWYKFLSSSKCTLGTPSGSSLIDFDNSLRKSVNKYLMNFPNASFIEIENACFPAMDGKYVITAISPRNIEAGLLKTCQILTQGSYSGILRPGEHYILLDDRMSNITEVINTVKDHGYLESLANRCRDVLLSHNELRMTSRIQRITDYINNKVQEKNIESHDKDFFRFKRKYERSPLMILKKINSWHIEELKSKIGIMFPKFKYYYNEIMKNKCAAFRA